MNQIPILIDGKLIQTIETDLPVKNVVLIPGKLINIVTDKPAPERYKVYQWEDERGNTHKQVIFPDGSEHKSTHKICYRDGTLEDAPLVDK